MAKGFKDSSGKFHPTGNNGTSSRDKSVETKGMKMMKVLNIEEPLSESSSSRKIQALTEKMQSPDAVLTEREINFMKNSLNRQPDFSTRDSELQEMIDVLDNNEDGLAITAGQTVKGLDWLKKKPQRDRMGFRELAVIDDFAEFRLLGLPETNAGSEFHTPFWRVIASDGSTFEYRSIGGELSIDG